MQASLQLSANPPRRPGTVADWLAADDELGLELIDGELVPKASPSVDHGSARLAIGVALRPPYHRRSGGPGGPGGWWFAAEPDVLLAGQGYRPDLAGWRRERAPELPRARPDDPEE